MHEHQAYVTETRDKTNEYLSLRAGAISMTDHLHTDEPILKVVCIQLAEISLAF